jgi:hypothetical protein
MMRCMFLRNVVICLRVYTASQPRRTSSWLYQMLLATVAATKGFGKNLDLIRGRNSINTLQKTVVLGTAHFLKKMHYRLKLEILELRSNGCPSGKHEDNILRKSFTATAKTSPPPPPPWLYSP